MEELESEHEAFEIDFHVAPFFVTVQVFTPAVLHDTVIVPPIFTRFGEALIDAETAGSEGVLTEQSLEPVQLFVLIEPVLVCPQEFAEEVQDEKVVVQTGADGGNELQDGGFVAPLVHDGNELQAGGFVAPLVHDGNELQAGGFVAPLVHEVAALLSEHDAVVPPFDPMHDHVYAFPLLALFALVPELQP